VRVVWLAVLATKRILPLAISPVTRRTSAVSPTLIPASLRSATSTTASIGSIATSVASSRPANENAAWPTSTATSCTTPGRGARERRFCCLELRLEIDELEPRERAGQDQRALGVELGAFLRDHRLRLRHLGLARLVGQDGNDLALLNPASTFDPELGQDAAGPRGKGDALVRFGPASDGELAAM